MHLPHWVQSNSNYESLEGSEKKHQGHLTPLTDLQIIIYSNTEHFLCGGKGAECIIHGSVLFFFKVSLNLHNALWKQTGKRKVNWQVRMDLLLGEERNDSSLLLLNSSQQHYEDDKR